MQAGKEAGGPAVRYAGRQLMQTTAIPAQYTPRDVEILRALARCPLSAEQLLRLSATFAQPFTAIRRVRRRLHVLALAGWVQRWQYATTSRGAQNYYKLSPAGFRLLNGPKTPLPSRGYFRAVSLGLQEHTRALADFIVHTLISAQTASIPVLTFHRENELRLEMGDEMLMPDCALQLRTGAGELLSFCIEIDNGTEPVFSSKERDSWQRKIRFYERYQDCLSQRFRVVVLTTKSDCRHLAILRAASQLVRNPQRRLLYAAPLADFLAAPGGVLAPCFLDHVQRPCAMVPPLRKPVAPPRPVPRLDLTLALW